jgi:DNA-binding CsgD family transcriptional regulator/tetratricopeptide (TPR) repeat protein
VDPEGLVGRLAEVTLLSGLVAEVAAGRGGVFLVEGEPGIGKTALLAAGVAEARRFGCGVVRGAGDELLGRFPLRVLLDAFEVRPGSGDERRRVVAEALAGGSSGTMSAGDPVAAAAEQLVALVERLCADAPLVVVLDDLHWADGPSLALWVRLADLTAQVPMLLAGACRSVPYREELGAIRQVAVARGHGMSLKPLVVGEVAQLVGRLAGGVPDEALLGVMGAAAGNPLWVGETVAALRHENAIRVGDGRAALTDVSYRAPASLPAAIGQRLTFLSAATLEVLRTAALFGGEFSVADLAAMRGRRPSDLLGAVGEASAAGVLGEVGGRLGFRHPLIRQALYERVPSPVRAALHGAAARALAEAGAPLGPVAAQLVAAGGVPAEAWQIDWLLRHGRVLINESPEPAMLLLEAALASNTGLAGGERYCQLAALLVHALKRERPDEANLWARRVLDSTADPDRAADMRVTLAGGTRSGSPKNELFTVVEEVLREAKVSPGMRAHMIALRALILDKQGDTEGAESSAREALAMGESAHNNLAVGLALNTLGGIADRRGDIETAERCVRLLVERLADDPECVSMRVIGQMNLGLMLAQLDRGPEAAEVFRDARALAERSGIRAALPTVFAAGVAFSEGRWDDASADLDTPLEFRPALALILWGVNALIAAHREDRRDALALLQRTDAIAISDIELHENSVHIVAAGALVAEQDGDLPGALAHLRALAGPEFSHVSNRYEFLADVVRLALAAGDDSAAREAVATAEGEAERVRVPGSRVAAAHCRGLLAGDPAAVGGAADYYRAHGRLPHLGAALQDAAALLAADGAIEAAKAAVREAEQVFIELGATWDLRQMAARLRPHGIRLGMRGPRLRPESGWAALTPTEVSVAQFVAEGLSNPDIGVKLLLSRRTVQTHVSHILAKLGVRARLEIAHHVASNAA